MNDELVRKVYEAIAEIYSRRENVKITLKSVRLRDERDDDGGKKVEAVCE